MSETPEDNNQRLQEIWQSMVGNLPKLAEETEKDKAAAESETARGVIDMGYKRAVLLHLKDLLNLMAKLGVQVPRQGVDYEGIVVGRVKGVSNDLPPVSLADFGEGLGFPSLTTAKSNE